MKLEYSTIVTRITSACLLGLFIASMPLATAQAQTKPRVCVLTDIGADADDVQSMVRFILYSNKMDIEGLIAGTSCWKQSGPDTGPIYEVINRFNSVRSNLLVHESGYPEASALSSVVKSGVNGYAMSAAAGQLGNEGITHIINILDDPDPRPIWFLGWGGTNSLGGAVMRLRNERSASEVESIVYNKIRGYEIALQDDSFAYIASLYPDVLLMSAKTCWRGFSPTTPSFNAWHWTRGGDESVWSHGWVSDNIQSHGTYGSYYPSAAYLWEGDTPSYMHLIPNGLKNDHEKWWWGSWGGRFERDRHPNMRTGTVENSEGAAEYWIGENGTVDNKLSQLQYSLIGNGKDTWTYEPTGTTYTDKIWASVYRWKTAYQHDFQARMDWTTTSSYSGANHPPVAVVDGSLTREVTPGDSVTLSAVGSSDPDGNNLSYKWYNYKEAGTYSSVVAVASNTSQIATATIPMIDPGLLPVELHFILEVTDNGNPTLTRYQRVICNVVDVVIPEPTDVNATALSGSEVYLTWTDNSSGDSQEDYFSIQRKPVDGIDLYQVVGTAPQNATSYNDTTVHGMVEYTYKVGATIDNP